MSAPVDVLADPNKPIVPCNPAAVMRVARGELHWTLDETHGDALLNAAWVVEELISAARIALANLERNLRSEEACGSPFMGDDDHAAIAILRAALARCKGEKA